MALTIAVDVSLNKLIVPSPSDALAGIHVGRPPSDCISARKALDLDGFYNIEPDSDFGRRLLRRRERIWLALFTLDRGWEWFGISEKSADISQCLSCPREKLYGTSDDSHRKMQRLAQITYCRYLGWVDRLICCIETGLGGSNFWCEEYLWQQSGSCHQRNYNGAYVSCLFSSPVLSDQIVFKIWLMGSSIVGTKPGHLQSVGWRVRWQNKITAFLHRWPI